MPDSVSLSGPRPHWHGFYQIEDKLGRWWRNTRVHYWFGFGDDGHGEAAWMFHVGAEWVHLHRTLRQLRLKVSTTGEETLDIAYGLGPLAQHYWAFDLDVPGKVAEKFGRTFRQRRALRLPPIRFDIELGLTQASWCFGHDAQGWSSTAPWKEKLRQNHVKWFKLARQYRNGEPQLVRAVEVEIPMPEAVYPAVVKLYREVRQPMLGPLWIFRTNTKRRFMGPRFYLPIGRKVLHYAEVTVPEGIPKPGKGENSWDIGPGHLYGTSTYVTEPFDSTDREWVATAVAAAIGSVLKSRIRHGHGLTFEREIADT